MSTTVSSVGGSSTAARIAGLNQSASNNAANHAIAQRMASKVNGLNQGAANAADMRNLVNTAEGGLSAINGSLQRLNELSIQASNGTLSQANRDLIQNEVNQILEGIESTIRQTQFNGISLLGGGNLHTAASADAGGPSVGLPSISLASLGLEGFDVTSAGFDASRVQGAIEAVGAARAQLGAASNTLGSLMSNNAVAAINQAAAKNRIQDTDAARASTKASQEEISQQYQLYAQNRARQQQEQTKRLFNA